MTTVIVEDKLSKKSMKKLLKNACEIVYIRDLAAKYAIINLSFMNK